MHWLAEYGMFAAKIFTVLFFILALFMGLGLIRMKLKSELSERLEIKPLNKKYKHMALSLQTEILDKKELKKLLKEEKKSDKEDKSDKKNVYVIDFDGDIKASAVDSLRDEISSVLTVAKPEDEVVLRLESPGGVVHGYGLAASQLDRLRDKSIPLTVCVDKVAASGGYMMACVADKILASPFAIIGSIGVLAQIPNFHKVLKKNDVDFEQFTAGEYKRTVTMLGETSKKDREKMQSDIDDIHVLFKDFVGTRRPKLDINKVSTGEYWFGTRAKELDLIDEISTSDDYLMKKCDEANLYLIKYSIKKPLSQRLPLALAQLLQDKPWANQKNYDYYR